MNAAFFDAVRPIFGGTLTQPQINGLVDIIFAFSQYGGRNPNALAYVLATPVIETNWTMQPITEYGPRAYFNKYEPGTAIGKRLGNTEKGDGYRYRGRGYVQITGRANYARAGKALGLDLIGSPELALNPQVAARILITGTSEGWFTGKGLGAYIDDLDETDDEDLREFINSRRTVNGTDRATEIGKIALVFEKALKADLDALTAAPAPPPEHVEPIELPVAPTVVEAPLPSTLGSLLASLFQLLLTLIKAFQR